MATYDETGQRICDFPDCGRRHSAKGLCFSHLTQQNKGKPLTALKPHKVKQTVCNQPDCHRAYWAKGLCRLHYSASTRIPVAPTYVPPPEDLEGHILPVVGFPHYWVSDFGEVWSETRGGFWLAEWISDSKSNHNGYREVQLSYEGKAYHRKIGRLVLEAFEGPCPPGYRIYHGNLGSRDDSLSNLKWVAPAKRKPSPVREGTKRMTITLNSLRYF